MRNRRRQVVLGWTSLGIGALLTEGGAMEAIVYWRQNAPLDVAVGIAGATASLLLLASGAAFLSRRRASRMLAVVAALACIPVHLFAWRFGNMGPLGLMLGVGYPALLLGFLRADPGLGTPQPIGDTVAAPEASRPDQRLRQVTATA